MTRRETWLRKRQAGIGGTDIASIAGVGYQTALDVYEEKVAPEPIDRQPTPLMMMGLATEKTNAELFSAKTGDRLKALGFTQSREVPWMFATFDRIAMSPVPMGPWKSVELKYTPFFGDAWGQDGSDEIPDSHLIQVTWQALILRERGHLVDANNVSVLSGSGEHRIFVVPFDDRLAEMLLELGGAFWKFVEARQAPLDWEHPLQSAIAQRLTEIRPETWIELGEHEGSLAFAYRMARNREKEAKEQADACKSELLAALGTNETGILPDGTRIRQRVVHRKSYAVEASSYVDFRVLSPSKKAKVLNGREE